MPQRKKNNNSKGNYNLYQNKNNENVACKAKWQQQFVQNEPSCQNEEAFVASSSDVKTISSQNGHLATSSAQNGLLQSGLCASKTNEEKLLTTKDLGAHLQTLSKSNIKFKYSSEALLYLYFILSWTFVTSLRRLDIFLESEERSIFSSVEEGVVYKVLWCFIFGCLTDFISWKTSFKVQALAWGILFIRHWCPNSYYIIQISVTVCASSSPLLISLVGIAKIWGNDCLGALARFGLIAYLLPLTLHLCNSDTSFPLGRIIEERIPAGLAFAFDYIRLFLTQFIKTVPEFVLTLGCALCLILSHPSEDDSDNWHSLTTLSSSDSRRSKVRTSSKNFFKVILLEAFVYIPASLWSALDKSDGEEQAWTMLSMMCLCLAIHGLLIPLLGYFLSSPRTALILCSVGLCVVYTLSAIIIRAANDDGISFIYLTIYAILCVFHTFFEAFLVTKMRGKIGVVFAAVLVMQLVIQFQARSLRLGVLRLREQHGSSWFTPSKAIIVLSATAFQKLFKRFSAIAVWPFEFLMPAETISLGDLVRPIVSFMPNFITSFCISKSERKITTTIEGENWSYIDYFYAIFLKNLPEEVDLGKDTTYLSFAGILGSSLALLLILSHRKR